VISQHPQLCAQPQKYFGTIREWSDEPPACTLRVTFECEGLTGRPRSGTGAFFLPTARPTSVRAILPTYASNLVAFIHATTCVLICVLAFTVYASQSSVSTNSATSEQSAIYTNDRWHFSIFVPAATTVSTQDDPDGGQSIQLLDPLGNVEIQIGTTPYTQLDVALGEEGAPSNTADQSSELGVVNVFRGDIVKVWFVKDGTFYIVSAMPQNEPQLMQILKTWQFD
jgi:hypothetical protein